MFGRGREGMGLFREDADWARTIIDSHDMNQSGSFQRGLLHGCPLQTSRGREVFDLLAQTKDANFVSRADHRVRRGIQHQFSGAPRDSNHGDTETFSNPGFLQ